MGSPKKVLVVALVVLAIASTVAAAGAIITGNTGSVIKLASPPASVKLNALENATSVYAFDERQNVTLASAVAIDAANPGTYTSFPNGNATVAAGTVVDSHLIHSDIPSQNFTTHRVGSVSFGADIVGVIASTNRLGASDSALGAPGTQYAGTANWRGLESGENNGPASASDKFTISADHRTLSFDLQTLWFDEIRILTKHFNPLTTTISDSPDPVQVGQPVTYTVTVTNNGTSAASNVQVQDNFPGATLVNATAPGTCTASTSVTCGLGNLAVGASASATIVVTSPSTVPAGGTITNTATAPPGSTPVASESTTVVAQSLSTTIVDAPDPVTVGNKVHYELTVKNTGIAPVANAHVTDTLPPDTTLVSATSSGGCTGTGPIDCALGTLAVGQEATAIILATVPGAVPAGGTITDHAIASPGANTEATAVTTVEAQEDGVSKGWVEPGGSLTIQGDNPATVTLPNTGDGAPIDITQGTGTFCNGPCVGPTTTVSEFPDYIDPNHPIKLVLTYNFPDAPGSLRNAAIAFNRTVYKLITPPSTGVAVPTCTNEGAGVADPHPCVDNRDIVNTGPNAYSVSFTILYISGDPTHGTR